MRQTVRDVSVSAFFAGLLLVLVGMASSAVIVFQAAQAAGVSAADSSSWLGAVCVGMGILTIAFSLYYRAPVLFAWSTPGAALVFTGAQGFSVNEIIGAFFFSGILIFISGITGWFEKLMTKIPMALASALLAGVLFHFTIDAFLAFNSQPILIGVMFFSYILFRKYKPKFTMISVLLFSIICSFLLGLLHFENFALSPTNWIFTSPEFSLKALISLGIPLFVVTMASQNLTGIAVMRAHAFQTPVSPMLTYSGIATIIASGFGGIAINLAAITAAIGMGPDAHPDPKKRYTAGLISGAFYIFIGLFAGVVTSVFMAFPKELVVGLAGFALIGTILTGLQNALAGEKEREAAFITFIVAASGISIFGIGSALWALIAGAVTLFIFNRK